MYTCGPTVYNFAHIGNFRAYITADILRRTLESQGYVVNHVMNITDVDDKTIRDSQISGETLTQFTTRYTTFFFEDLAQLNILPATTYPRATDNIEQMVSMIEVLIQKGHAYAGEDGSVYFNIRSDADYGKLSGAAIDEEVTQSRVSQDEYTKDNVQDFALWKAWDQSDGDVFWETSLGKGRPGWHIECSAMSMRYLGRHFDIHTGGIDLLFPHHENEIAQTESATDEKFVNYWVHNEFVQVEGKKMSKSLGNFFMLQDIIDRGYDPMTYRYIALQTHYRKPFNFTWDSLEAGSIAYSKLIAFVRSLPKATEPICREFQAQFMTAMEDDLNTAQALATLWECVKSDRSPEKKAATLLLFDKVLGLGLDKFFDTQEEIPGEILDLVTARETARTEKNWTKSDEIRAKIEERGFELQDTPEGARVVKK